MAEEDRRPLGGRAAFPCGYRQTRTALRRMARARQRRRWLVEAVVAFALLAAVVAYLGTEQHSGPREETVVIPGRPDGGRPLLPSTRAEQPGADAVTPGLQPRHRSPSPSPSPSRPVAGPQLAVRRGEVPALVDLTAVGTVDWIHWGLLGADPPVRKRNGSGEIRDEGGRGDRDSYRNNPEAYGWRDGSPVQSASGTTSGVYTCDEGNGFVLSVAGNGELRTVRLYAGLWMARGRLDVRLSIGGPTSTLRMEDPHTEQTAEFTIRFRAPRGAKLLMSWTVEESFGDYGNVGVQAVALR